MQNGDAATMVREWGCNVMVTGGDLGFFIDGLQKAVTEIKTGAGELVEETKTDVPDHA